MQRLTELFWRPLHNVRSQERSRFLFFAGLATLISIAQTLGLTGSEALFMAEFGIEYLPATIIAGSIVTVLGCLVYATRVGEMRNDILLLRMLIAVGVVLVAATVSLRAGLPGVSIFLLCSLFLTEAIFVNHLWTFMTDYFDSVASKRLIPLFTLGMSVGGIFGGLLAFGLSRALGPFSSIAAWALFLWLAAGMLRLGRRRLRGWGPIDLEEADETSVEGIQGAARYVRGSKLGRSLLISAVGMILAIVVARYMWLQSFAQRFPNPEELAAFIGLFLAVTNGIEIAIEMTVTPWLIRRFGVPSANLVHPAMTLLCFAGMAYQYNLATSAAARMNGEMLENSLANPIRSLLCNAVPLRFRGRVRAFLEGIVVYAGMTIGGATLLALGHPDPLWLAFAGGAASAIYLAANLLVRRNYLDTLVDELRAGRLDLANLSDEIGNWETSRLAELWEQLLQTEGELPSAPLVDLIPSLATRGILQPLQRSLSHPSPAVRRSCIIALASTGNREVETFIAEALEDSEAQVRLAAMRGLLRLHPDALDTGQIRTLIGDPDPLVRAEAAVVAKEEGRATLANMIDSADSAESVAALSCAPSALLETVRGRIHDADPAVRAAALECAARIGIEMPLTVEEARRALEDPDSRVRRAAVLLLSNLDGDDALCALASAVSDDSSEVKFIAESVLSSLGDAALDWIEGDLEAESEQTVACVLRVLARSNGQRSRQVLGDELKRRVREIWYWTIAGQRIQEEDAAATRFLHAAFLDRVDRDRRLAFRILEHLESPGIVQNVEKALRFGSTRSRGDALEVLSHLGDRDSAQLLVIFHEASSLADRIAAASKLLSVPDTAHEIIAKSRASSAKWIRLGAHAVELGTQESQETQFVRSEITSEEETMERLLALRQISLFNHLSLEQLEAVDRVSTEEEYLSDEVIVREGERGDRLFLLLEGRVRILRNYRAQNEILLNETSAVGYFGEMAILDGEPRSASIVTSEPSRVLRLDGDRLRELLIQMPEISFKIFHVLAGRVRAAEDRLAGG